MHPLNQYIKYDDDNGEVFNIISSYYHEYTNHHNFSMRR